MTPELDTGDRAKRHGDGRFDRGASSPSSRFPRLGDWFKIDDHGHRITYRHFMVSRDDIGPEPDDVTVEEWARGVAYLIVCSCGDLRYALTEAEADDQAAAIIQGAMDHLKANGVRVPPGY